MIDLTANLNNIRERIKNAEKKYTRPPNSVALLAISKAQPLSCISTLYAAGQQDWGESYVQEALKKISAFSPKQLHWHFIGPIQSNKTGDIARNFSWVHSICRLKEAEKLSRHRPMYASPLNVCIQVKLDDAPQKSGVSPAYVSDLILQIQHLPRLKVRGLMTVPPFVENFAEQRKYFRLVKTLFMEANQNGAQLDTLSMGMTHDFEAAIAEGATIVRIGTGLFGPRQG